MGEIQIESALPEGWIPEGAFVHVFARRDREGQWEAVIPEFTIGGVGGAPEAAVQNALELLDDYLLLCAREGRSFEESYRPFGRELQFAMLRDAIDALLSSWVRRRPLQRRRSKSRARYKVPLRLLGVH